MPKKTIQTKFSIKSKQTHFSDKKNAVEALIRNGVDVDMQTEQGMTALHFAVSLSESEKLQNEIQVFELFHLLWLYWNFKWSNWKWQLTDTFFFIDFENIVKVLVENGAKIDIKDNKDDSPLSLALKNERKEIADYMIASGNFKLKPQTIISENATDLQPEKDVNFKQDWKDALYGAICQGTLEKRHENILMYFSLIFMMFIISLKNSDDEVTANLLIRKYVNDIKTLEEPYFLHLAAQQGSLAKSSSFYRTNKISFRMIRSF